MALLSHIVELGLIEPRAAKITLFAEGILHLHLKLTMLLKVPLMRHCAKEEGVGKTILFNPVRSWSLRYAGVHGLSDGVVA